MENKYTFKLTMEEMRMIRNALALEVDRRETNNLDKVDEYDALVYLFTRRIIDATK